MAETGMEYGGITPVGLPPGWPVLVDAAVAATAQVVIGSGVRRSKLVLPGAALAGLPGARVIENLARLTCTRSPEPPHAPTRRLMPTRNHRCGALQVPGRP